MPRLRFVSFLAWPAAALAAVCALTTLAGCGADDLALPPAPDVNALVADYQTPAGTIDPQQIDAVLADARARLDQLHLDWLPDLLAQSLTNLQARLDDAGYSGDPAKSPSSDRPQLDAKIDLTRICRGWDRRTPRPTES